MVEGDNESTATKNACKLMAISTAMAMQWYYAGCITRWSTSGASLEPLDTAIGRVPAPYHPGGRHGQRIQIKHTKH